MALTADRLALLNDEYLSASETSEESEPSPAKRLQRAKASVYAHMRSLGTLGREGSRILRNDELYLAGPNDVQFRDIDRNTQDVDNLEFWEAKDQFLKDQFRRLYDQLNPLMRQSRELGIGNPQIVHSGAIPRAEMIRGLVGDWASSVENPGLVAPGAKSDDLPVSPPLSGLVAVPVEREGRPTKRKAAFVVRAAALAVIRVGGKTPLCVLPAKPPRLGPGRQEAGRRCEPKFPLVPRIIETLQDEALALRLYLRKGMADEALGAARRLLSH
ncbi:hypothetical protein NUW58_g547 [Xylaria curta]|uniref:Uncharacterized protein n=1 Tax=Xylaria curta TaxID=42375 RepID=A0ACC1PRV0_9PEZI|nr:hypothetical protein NUW58_g547 [Xylaria curta]